MTDFDPAAHRMVPEQRWFEDFVVGERFVHPEPHPDLGGVRGVPDRERRYPSGALRRRILPRPRHAAPARPRLPDPDPHRARRRPVSVLVEESLVGFLEQSSRFLKPVFADDTIYPALEVTELVPGRSTGVVTLAAPCSTSAASWCWRACRNS